jgi:predicted metal-dependent phosphoesterase TrpH
MRYDFHSHTHFSDGVLSPSELVERAIEKGVELLAISDHDSVGGIKDAKQAVASDKVDLQIVPAIELSAKTEFGEVHVVGLNIDIANGNLLELIDTQQKKRWLRVETFESKFQQLGVDGVLEYLKNNVKQVVTRTHVARALVELGFVNDNQQAFKKYLGKKGRVKAPIDWMSLETAVDAIHGAGGHAVLAHPTRYPMSNRRLTYLIEEFSVVGGDAIEVAYPSLSPDKRIWLDGLRRQFNLLASAGSDFHYPDLKWSDLGFFPNVRDDVPHVIDRFKHHYL